MSQTQPECGACVHRDRCSEVYRRMGASTAPPVTGQVVRAFVVPLVLFVVVLGAGQPWLGGPGAGVLAAAATIAYAWLARGRRRSDS